MAITIKSKHRKLIKLVLINLTGIIIFLIILFPVIWLGITSFKSHTELYNLPIRYLPKKPTLEAYYQIFSRKTYAGQALPWQNYLFNSFFVAGISTVIVVCLASIAGYGFSRFKFKADKALLTLLILTRMLPGPALMVPIYIMISSYGLYDSLWGLILVHTAFGLPLTSWLCFGFFNAIPKELEEAAFVDGCSRIKAFIHVVLPMGWIGVVSVGTYHFVGSWSEFAFASILLESQKIRTAPVGLADFIFLFGTAFFNRVGAAAITMAIPITIMFLIFQRHFIRGFLAGSLKE